VFLQSGGEMLGELIRLQQNLTYTW
jgi:hypothetical protein